MPDRAELEFIHEACRTMGRPLNTRFLVCSAHGVRAPIDDVYGMNNWENRDGLISCAPDHPYCWEGYD